jgi:pimeloyl-ACP methyl ester carboxylesterase
MSETIPHFRTSTGEAAYQLAYDRTLGLWPAEREALEVKTSFGTTRVNAIGPKDAPPAVLIHGFGFSSTQWYPNVGALTPARRIYAPDVPDQMGLSTLEQPLQTPDNYACWVGELLDGLQLGRVSLAGHSYGGWISANFAARQPERVVCLSLISPAATFVPLTIEFYIRGILGGMLARDWMIYGMVQWMTTLRNVRGLAIVEQFKTGMQNMAQIPAGFPKVLGAAAFSQLRMPVQFIIGDHEVIYTKRPAAVVKRARQLIPHLQAALIPNGGHAVTLDQTAETNRQLQAFMLN